MEFTAYIKEWKNGEYASLCSVIIANVHLAVSGQAQRITKQKMRRNVRLDVATVTVSDDSH